MSKMRFTVLLPNGTYERRSGVQHDKYIEDSKSHQVHLVNLKQTFPAGRWPRVTTLEELKAMPMPYPRLDSSRREFLVCHNDPEPVVYENDGDRRAAVLKEASGIAGIVKQKYLQMEGFRQDWEMRATMVLALVAGAAAFITIITAATMGVKLFVK